MSELVTMEAVMTTPSLDELSRKVDALSAQLQNVTDYIEDQRRRQRERDELKDDLIPIVNDMYLAAVEELSQIEPYVRLEDILHLLKRLARNTHNIENMLDQLESLNDLLQDLGPIFNEAFLAAVTKLDEMERKGYFENFRQGFYIIDNIVEAFGPEDVKALGDNIVTILTTVREMTQPEVMETVQNLTARMREVEEKPEQVDTSFIGLLRQLRDPHTRRGLALTLQMLKAMGEEQPGSGSRKANGQTH
ncbi:MAG: DUF1641 domain-containing protein [Caldilineae bacterium]|nr:MAG: DUF1641 domain-containing protein [Caldilineae bacterium]